MKKLLFDCLSLFGLAKSEKSDDPQALLGIWRVLLIHPTGKCAQWAWRRYSLHFNEDGYLYFNLSANTCDGQYSSTGPGHLKIEDVYCTLMCCDSPFSDRLAELLISATSFEVQGRTLLLFGRGGVIKAKRRKSKLR